MLTTWDRLSGPRTKLPLLALHHSAINLKMSSGPRRLTLARTKVLALNTSPLGGFWYIHVPDVSWEVPSLDTVHGHHTPTIH